MMMIQTQVDMGIPFVGDSRLCVWRAGDDIRGITERARKVRVRRWLRRPHFGASRCTPKPRFSRLNALSCIRPHLAPTDSKSVAREGVSGSSPTFGISRHHPRGRVGSSPTFGVAAIPAAWYDLVMRIGILTGGGDVPGLNPCIKAVVNRVGARRARGRRPPPRLGRAAAARPRRPRVRRASGSSRSPRRSSGRSTARAARSCTPRARTRAASAPARCPRTSPPARAATARSTSPTTRSASSRRSGSTC